MAHVSSAAYDFCVVSHGSLEYQFKAFSARSCLKVNLLLEELVVKVQTESNRVVFGWGQSDTENEKLVEERLLETQVKPFLTIGTGVFGWRTDLHAHSKQAAVVVDQTRSGRVYLATALVDSSTFISFCNRNLGLLSLAIVILLTAESFSAVCSSLALNAGNIKL